MTSRLIASTMLGLFACGWTFGQQPGPQSGDSHKYRTIFTLAGGGGGFAVGLVAGLAAFDDATNSDRKVWTTAALSAAGGAVGGYFLGRALDKRQKKPKVTWMPAEFERSWIRSQWSDRRANESSGSWPRARLANSVDDFLTGRQVGMDQANRHVTPYWDLSYLYLVSHLRRIENGRLAIR
jgi:hypothetical protein